MNRINKIVLVAVFLTLFSATHVWAQGLLGQWFMKETESGVVAKSVLNFKTATTMSITVSFDYDGYNVSCVVPGTYTKQGDILKIKFNTAQKKITEKGYCSVASRLKSMLSNVLVANLNNFSTSRIQDLNSLELVLDGERLFRHVPATELALIKKDADLFEKSFKNNSSFDFTKDWATSINENDKKLASEGDTEAINKLGQYYFLEEDYDESFKWDMLSVQNGFADAMFRVSVCYGRGVGTNKDIQKSVYYCEKAAQKGYVAALYNLALSYRKGDGVEQNVSKEIQYFNEAGEKGDKDAYFELGLIYQYGYGVPIDYKKAADYYIKGALLGSSTAQLNLGYMYENGQGVAKDLKKSIEYYLLAAKQGNASALYNMGTCYMRGSGVSMNYKEAIKFFLLAARQDDDGAIKNLKLMGITKYE